MTPNEAKKLKCPECGSRFIRMSQDALIFKDSERPMVRLFDVAIAGERVNVVSFNDVLDDVNGFELGWCEECTYESELHDFRPQQDTDNVEYLERDDGSQMPVTMRNLEQERRDAIQIRALITNHAAVEDWEQNGPNSFTCYLAVGHYFRGETSFDTTSLQRMWDILRSNAIEVVENL